MAEQETVTKTTLLSIKQRQETEGYTMLNKVFQVIRIFYNIHSNSMTKCSKKNPFASTVHPSLVIKVVGRRWKPRRHGNWFLLACGPAHRTMNTLKSKRIDRAQSKSSTIPDSRYSTSSFNDAPDFLRQASLNYPSFALAHVVREDRFLEFV